MKLWKRVQEQVPEALASLRSTVGPRTAENNSNLNFQIQTLSLPQFVDD